MLCQVIFAAILCLPVTHRIHFLMERVVRKNNNELIAHVTVSNNMCHVHADQLNKNMKDTVDLFACVKTKHTLRKVSQ